MQYDVVPVSGASVKILLDLFYEKLNDLNATRNIVDHIAVKRVLFKWSDGDKNERAISLVENNDEFFECTMPFWVKNANRTLMCYVRQFKGEDKTGFKAVWVNRQNTQTYSATNFPEFLKEDCMILLRMFLAFNEVAVNYTDAVDVKEKQVNPKKHSKGGKTSKGKQRRVRFYKQYTLNKDKLKQAQRTEKKKPVRHCEMWGVRGHYRHYSSGKIVYIAPYTKGKGTYAPKEYAIHAKEV